MLTRSLVLPERPNESFFLEKLWDDELF